VLIAASGRSMGRARAPSAARTCVSPRRAQQVHVHLAALAQGSTEGSSIAISLYGLSKDI
jgi:hypothetical protein